MDVPPRFAIIDKRETKNLKTVTISGYKKNDCINSLILSIKKCYIQKSCFWCGELLASGHLYILLNKYIYKIFLL